MIYSNAREEIARLFKEHRIGTWFPDRPPIPNDYVFADRALALLALTQPAPDTRSEGGWRPEVRAFADLMEAQLRANDHKPGWKEDDALDLLTRLRQETGELGQELVPGSRTDFSAWTARVGREAADVANFAMMIADVCGALPSPPQAKTSSAGEVEWKLPYDVEINHIRFRKGIDLDTFVSAARRWHSMIMKAQPAVDAAAFPELADHLDPSPPDAKPDKGVRP